MYAFEVLGGLSSSSAGFPSLEAHSHILSEYPRVSCKGACRKLLSGFLLPFIPVLGFVCLWVFFFVFCFCRHCFYSLPSFKEDTFLYSCTNTLFLLFVLVQYVSHSWNSQAGYVFFYWVIIITGLVSPEHWINDVTLFSMLSVTVS